MNRTENAIRNITWGVVEKIATLLLPFVTRTILIYVLGAEYLGLGSLFTSILQVLSVTELGFGAAVVFSMYKPIAENDNDTLCALINMYRKIYRVVGTIILIGGLMILPFLKVLIKGEVQADVNIYVLYIIYLFNTVISYFLYGYKAVIFTAHQRSDVTSKRTTIINIVGSFVQCVALLLFKNYYIYILIIPVITILTNVLNAYLASKLYPEIVCRGKLGSEMIQDIKKRVVGLISFKINSVIFESADTIVISSFLGLLPLAIFNNYYYIMRTIVGFLGILTVSITAGIGNKMVTNSRAENYKDFMSLVFVNGWIASWCSVCLLCLYNHFINLWIGEKFLFSDITVVLMVLYFFIPRITTITYTYREAAGLWWEDKYRPVISSVLNLIISIILVQYIGINGVILGTLIVSVVITVPWATFILFKYYFHCSPINYFKRLVYYTLVTVLGGGLTYFICTLLPFNGIIPFILKGLVCLTVPNIVFLLFYYKLDEFNYAKSLAMYLLRKVQKGRIKNEA